LIPAFYCQAEGGIRGDHVTGVQTCALPICVDYPQGLFQCLWNSCWWYDCPKAAGYHSEPAGGWTMTPPWKRSGAKLAERLERWQIGRASCRERGEVTGEGIVLRVMYSMMTE